MKSVYLDNAATTAILPEVVNTMTEVLTNTFGNPSSTHNYGRNAKAIVEQARKTIAKQLNVSSSEIIFTSGGTEADNLILQSAVKDLGVKTIITTKIEHHAVLNTIIYLSKHYDVEIVYLDLDESGQINYNQLGEFLKSKDNVLVSLMHVNNEIGNILDIKKVANLCQENKALFHSDTVQSIGHYNLDLQDIKVDFAAVSAHKFHGPKGVGFAFIRKNSGLHPIIFGGEQERGQRAGTEALHNIAGLETAFKIAYQNLETDKTYITNLKSYCLKQLKKEIPSVKFNGLSDTLENSAYTIINMRLPEISKDATMIQFHLDLKGIACSRGSACQSGSTKNSHVLEAILAKEALKKASLRVSFSKFNTKEDVDYLVNVLKELF
ncbi:cysteine desulfurase [Mesoflavibacter sabulilitoris]|uniref:cysteine desulfurase n=1 Tax=Mesoflavibacter zeaxanthinifaciens subsp. sabulilitoris TaxID=1520893 RepID=A0A2T1NEW8_9FLAO|nr:cysteine desulfurase family protein [Mesoflavibacter zeaxanthinifaciens]MBB3124932.1 cysteine desulfurase [Mesoflavibacter zeaxanthinifaciens subsp. sabulilitoris]PSG90988.1 cysteine desulfurase [Mesoflavibacter zeaxanthinifaciens subsp. sabulilitoris]